MGYFRDADEVYRFLGPAPKLLALVPLLAPVFPRYRELLVEQGRADLAGA